MNLAAFNLADYTQDEAFDVQRELARRGLYNGKIDGLFGPVSREALGKALASDAAGAPPTVRAVVPEASVSFTEDDQAPLDARSETNLATLAPAVQPHFRATLNRTNALPEVRAAGLVGEYTSGTRTYAEQQALFDQHNGTTNAPAGYSNHNFTLAADMTFFRGKETVYDSPLYRKYGETGESVGLTWGGRWHMDDEPHLEYHPAWAEGMSEEAVVSELRRRHAAGEDLLA